MERLGLLHLGRATWAVENFVLVIVDEKQENGSNEEKDQQALGRE